MVGETWHACICLVVTNSSTDEFVFVERLRRAVAYGTNNDTKIETKRDEINLISTR